MHVWSGASYQLEFQDHVVSWSSETHHVQLPYDLKELQLWYLGVVHRRGIPQSFLLQYHRFLQGLYYCDTYGIQRVAYRYVRVIYVQQCERDTSHYHAHYDTQPSIQWFYLSLLYL